MEMWCEKIFREKDMAEVIVLLIPLNKGSALYFHKYIYPYVEEIRMVNRRLSFYPLVGQKVASNPMGSMLCILRGQRNAGNKETCVTELAEQPIF